MYRDVAPADGWTLLVSDVMGARPCTPLLAALEQPITDEAREGFDEAWSAVCDVNGRGRSLADAESTWRLEVDESAERQPAVAAPPTATGASDRILQE